MVWKPPMVTTIYPKIRTEERVCEYGDKHRITVYGKKRVRFIGIHIHDNGYEQLEMPIYRDAQGRRWFGARSYDYTARTYYTCTLPHGGGTLWAEAHKPSYHAVILGE